MGNYYIIMMYREIIKWAVKKDDSLEGKGTIKEVSYIVSRMEEDPVTRHTVSKPRECDVMMFRL